MKTLLIGLMTVLGAAFSIAGSEATTLADNLKVEAGASISNFTTDRGLAPREDSLGASILLGAPVGGGTFAFDFGLSDTDDGGELDFSASYAKGISLLGQNFDLTAGISSVESVFGDREEVFVGLGYTWVADLTATVWHEDNNEWYGVELGASYDIETPVAGLIATPFATVNIADEYSAVEVGVKATYKVSDQLSVGAKASYNNNDFDGSSFDVDNEWIIGAGASFKF